jgi:hypothetical protein
LPEVELPVSVVATQAEDGWVEVAVEIGGVIIVDVEIVGLTADSGVDAT